MNSKEVSITKEMIINYLNTDINIESLNDIFEISAGNKDVLKSHIKALINIFTKALEEIENEDSKE